MKRKGIPIATVLLLLVTAAAAQDTDAGRNDVKDRLLRAIRLPRTADEARQAGIPDDQVREAIDVVRGHGIDAGDAQLVLEEEVRSVKENGPIDNFGAFVRSRLDSGLRGRELAEAIRAEHAARGKKAHGGSKAGPGGKDATGKSKGKHGGGGR